MQPLSRTALLSWVNASLPPSVPAITRLDSLKNGAVFCFLTCALFPIRVCIDDVRINAESEEDVQKNYSVLYDVLSSSPGPKTLIADLNIDDLSEGRVGEIARFVQRLEFLARVQKTKKPAGMTPTPRSARDKAVSYDQENRCNHERIPPVELGGVKGTAVSNATSPRCQAPVEAAETMTEADESAAIASFQAEVEIIQREVEAEIAMEV